MNKQDLYLKMKTLREKEGYNRSEVVETMEIDGLSIEIYGNGQAIRKEKDGTTTDISIGFVRDMEGVLRRDLLRERNESADGIKTEKYFDLKQGSETLIHSEREDRKGNVEIEQNIPERIGIGRDKNGVLKNNIRRPGKKQILFRYADGSRNLIQEENGEVQEEFSDAKGNKIEKKSIKNALDGKISVLEEIQTSADGSKTEKTFSLEGNVLSEVHTSKDGTKTTKRMDRNGKLEVETKISNNGDEEVKYYDDKGQLALTTKKDRKGMEVEYDKDGKLQKVTVRKNGTTTVRTGLIARLSALANRKPS